MRSFGQELQVSFVTSFLCETQMRVYAKCRFERDAEIKHTFPALDFVIACFIRTPLTSRRCKQFLKGCHFSFDKILMGKSEKQLLGCNCRIGVPHILFWEKLPSSDPRLEQDKFLRLEKLHLGEELDSGTATFCLQKRWCFFFENQLHTLISRTFMALVESSYLDPRSITSFSQYQRDMFAGTVPLFSASTIESFGFCMSSQIAPSGFLSGLDSDL